MNDLLVVNGDVTLDGTLNLASFTELTKGTYKLIDYTGTLTDNGPIVGNNFGTGLGQIYSIAIDTVNKDVNLVVAPEPGNLALAAFACLPLARRRIRRIVRQQPR